MQSSTDPSLLEEEDEVLHEFDVHFAANLTGQLHLLQHPVRTRRYGRGLEPIEAHFKPNARRLQFTLPINTARPSYDEDRGRELAKAEEAHRKRQQSTSNTSTPLLKHQQAKEQDTSNALLDRVSIGSTTMPLLTNYMVGVLGNDGLHLTPVVAAHQLRPTLHHLDAFDEQNKRSSKMAGNGADDDDDMDDDTEKDAAKARLAASKAVQIKVKSTQEMEQAKQERNASQIYWQQKIDEETWIPYKYANVESDIAYDTFGRLFSTLSMETPLECTTSSGEYLDQLLAEPLPDEDPAAARLPIRP
ncbi:DNA-directed RNA polymerase III subunit Rpc5 [Syncephalis plumigaleata]|nr:DNA-directed RNA polymerase III subunit Rpc5 [Syncephalis plumigaleata]